jgi:hypothetical protein
VRIWMFSNEFRLFWRKTIVKNNLAFKLPSSNPQGTALAQIVGLLELIGKVEDIDGSIPVIATFLFFIFQNFYLLDRKYIGVNGAV